MDCHNIPDCSSYLSALPGVQAILCPSSPSNVMDWYTHPTPSFERKFCSDFICCGQPLADLHELVDHFEEAHVVVIGSNGNDAYPSSRIGSNLDSPSSYSSATPFAKAVFADHGARISKETFGATHGCCTSVGLATDFDVLSVDTTADQLCLPPSSFTADGGCDTEVQASHDHQFPWPASLTPRMEKKRPRALGVSRRRDKSHKCPRPGCTKSYLNANGLKYHLEKGTCSLEPTLCLVEAPGSE